jgi:hypothetical protein
MIFMKKILANWHNSSVALEFILFKSIGAANNGVDDNSIPWKVIFKMRQPTAETVRSIGFLTKLVEASCNNGLQLVQISYLFYSSERINSRSTHSMNCFPPTIFTNSIKQACKN